MNINQLISSLYNLHLELFESIERGRQPIFSNQLIIILNKIYFNNNLPNFSDFDNYEIINIDC